MQPLQDLKLPIVLIEFCQFMQTPSESHWQAIRRILRYLARTLDFGLTLQSNSHQTMMLEGYCDTDWASNRSTSKFCIFLGSNLISWQ